MASKLANMVLRARRPAKTIRHAAPKPAWTRPSETDAFLDRHFGSDAVIVVTAKDVGDKEEKPKVAESVVSRPEIMASLSASTGTIPGIAKLHKEAAAGDTGAALVLRELAGDTLRHLTGGLKTVDVKSEHATGLYGGDFEPSLGVRMRFSEEERPHALAALAKLADNFNQEQLHVRAKPDEGTNLDHTYPDMSYNTVSYRIPLAQPLGRKEIEGMVTAAGLHGVTATDKHLEAYHVRGPGSLDQFREGVKRLDQLIGGDGGPIEERTHRLWVYGRTEGAIGYDRIRGDLRPGPAEDSRTARRIASRLAGREVPGVPPAAKLTPEQISIHKQIADNFAELPVRGDRDDPAVRQAYGELASEIKEQYESLPIKVTAMYGGGEPYKNSRAMREDVHGNNHLNIFGTDPTSFGPPGVDYGDHPLLASSGQTDSHSHPLVVNDSLRAVHDYYAHTMTPVQFGPLGEEAAWRNHMSTIRSPMARWALTTETRGQNSVVNFGPNGEHNRANPKDTIFADQKTGLLNPKWAMTGDKHLDAEMAAAAMQHGWKIDEDGEWVREPQSKRRRAGKKDTASQVAERTHPHVHSPEFKNWFGDWEAERPPDAVSQVTHDNGQPKVVYHGTKADADFDAFAAEREGTNSNVFGSWKVKRSGIFFAESPELAAEFAMQTDDWREGAQKKARTIPVFLSIKHPADFRDGAFSDELSDGLEKEGLNLGYYHRVNPSEFWEVFDHENGGKEFVAALQKLGYDGARITEKSGGDVENTDTWVAFDPRQVKSATGNEGTYDPDDPRIHKHLDVKNDKPRKFSSTQFNLEDATILDGDSDPVQEILDFGKAIPDGDLAADGREDNIHCTCLFGLHTDDLGDVADVVRGHGPVEITLGKTSLFPANEKDAQRGGDQYDVLKIDVDSPDLHALNRKIADSLEHTDTYPRYVPHITIAYLTPGAGAKYSGDDRFEGRRMSFDAITFSDQDSHKTKISLLPAADDHEQHLMSAMTHQVMARAVYCGVRADSRSVRGFLKSSWPQIIEGDLDAFDILAGYMIDQKSALTKRRRDEDEAVLIRRANEDDGRQAKRDREDEVMVAFRVAEDLAEGKASEFVPTLGIACRGCGYVGNPLMNDDGKIFCPECGRRWRRNESYVPGDQKPEYIVGRSLSNNKGPNAAGPPPSSAPVPSLSPSSAPPPPPSGSLPAGPNDLQDVLGAEPVSELAHPYIGKLIEIITSKIDEHVTDPAKQQEYKDAINELLSVVPPKAIEAAANAWKEHGLLLDENAADADSDALPARG